MVEHTQKIRPQRSTYCLSMFDYFWGLTLKGLKTKDRSTLQLKMNIS